MNRTKCFWVRPQWYLMVVMSLVCTFGGFSKVSLAAENESVQFYKMLSSIEYSGKEPFKNQVETLFTVRKQFLSDDNVRYFISSEGLDLLEENQSPAERSSSNQLSFVIDEKTGRLSEGGKDLEFLQKVNNHCVSSLKKVTKDNIGKTWEQSFNMPFLDHLLDGEMRFTLTAIKLKTKVFGDMVAVRALSEPFIVKAAKLNRGSGNIKSRISTVYLFDPEIEDIYLSASVFEATTNSKEKLRYEIATYKTDAAGKSVDLSGLGRDFEKLVSKLGLTNKGLKVVKKASLPQWAQYEGLAAGQVANVCAAIACEGASNPVATICIPTAHTVAMQSRGMVGSIGMVGPVGRALASRVAGIGTLKIAVGPAMLGLSPTTAGLIAGGSTAIAVGAGGGGGGGGDRSPSTL